MLDVAVVAGGPLRRAGPGGAGGRGRGDEQRSVFVRNNHRIENENEPTYIINKAKPPSHMLNQVAAPVLHRSFPLDRPDDHATVKVYRMRCVARRSIVRIVLHI